MVPDAQAKTNPFKEYDYVYNYHIWSVCLYSIASSCTYVAMFIIYIVLVIVEILWYNVEVDDILPFIMC